MPKPKSAKSQCEKILKDLKAGKVITSLTGFKKYNAVRLTARLWELRHGKFDGNEYPIKAVRVDKNHTHYYKYSMEAA